MSARRPAARAALPRSRPAAPAGAALPPRRVALPDLLPATLFLAAYFAPGLFGAETLRGLRGAALLHLLFYWIAMGVAARLLVRADHDPAATRRRVLVAGGVLAAGALLAGGAVTALLLPLALLTVLIVWNLWDAAQAGRAALRVERALGLALLPCLLVALGLTQAIKPHFDHAQRSPELLTAGLLLAALAAVRAFLARR